MDKRREPEPTFFESPIWKAMFPFNWQRMWSGIVPSTLAGGVGGFLYATGTGRAIVLTPAAWSLYAAASSTAFFGLREWMFAPEGLDNLENEPVWKQLATSLYPGTALGAVAGLASKRGTKAVFTGALVAGAATTAIHTGIIAYRMYAPILLASWGINDADTNNAKRPLKVANTPAQTDSTETKQPNKNEWWKPVRKIDSKQYEAQLKEKIAMAEAEERLRHLEHEAKRRRIQARLEAEKQQQ